MRFWGKYLRVTNTRISLAGSPESLRNYMVENLRLYIFVKVVANGQPTFLNLKREVVFLSICFIDYPGSIYESFISTSI